ncbi:MAG: alpha-L-fucosidase [Bulleidia sp.]|nr:alpha-L-fucosidase [Bulleidia sp.]
MDRVQRFESLRFGMFIHFGLYSQASEGEWAFHENTRVHAEYEKLFHSFNPVNLDFDFIVKMAKNAGCRYIVLTARHHDGFSLYDTRGLNDYDVMHTPYGKDIVKAFVAACRKYDILPFFYHTTLDWQNPDFQNDFPRYQQYLRDSVKILCTEYGEVGGFWFDGNWSGNDVDWEEDALYSMIRRYQPDAIITNNSGLDARGARGNKYLDTMTFEQGHLQDDGTRDKGRHLALETCQTMNHHWGASHLDLDYHPMRFFIEELNECRRNNANYLLNIEPEGDGSIPLMCQAVLHELGTWMNMYKETFYEGTISSIIGDSDTYVLDGNGCSDIYCRHVKQLGVEHVVEEETSKDNLHVLKNVPHKVKRIFWIDNDEDLPFHQEGTTVSFHALGFPYGRNLVVRAARMLYEE